MSNNIHVIDLEDQKVKEFKDLGELCEFINDLTDNFKDIAKRRYFFAPSSEATRNILQYLIQKGRLQNGKR